MYYFVWTQISQYLRQSFQISAIVGTAIFLFTRTIFFELPFYFAEDIGNLFKTIAVSWLLLTTLYVGFNILEKFILTIIAILILMPIDKRNIFGITLITLITSFLSSCTENKVGLQTNITTGMTTTYQGIKVGHTDMVMNDEIINHNDIPLGESFEIINKEVKGLVIKEDKVNISCSLLIKDAQEKNIFSKADLFDGNGIFSKDSASYLRCTINTGSPMELDENYTVIVVFKDKNGKGQIENKVNIRMIDIP